MLKSDLPEFCEMALQNPELLAQLRDTPDTNAFFDLILRMGAERGYTFTGGDVEADLQNIRFEWVRRGQ